MSNHIIYDFQCSHCKAFYIRHDIFPCPKCGVVGEDKDETILPQMINEFRNHMKQYGQFTPPAWVILSFGDHIFFMLCRLFDLYESKNKGHAFQFNLWFKENLDKIKFGDQDYLRGHIYPLGILIKKQLNGKKRIPFKPGGEWSMAFWLAFFVLQLLPLNDSSAAFAFIIRRDHCRTLEASSTEPADPKKRQFKLMLCHLIRTGTNDD